MSVDVRAVSSKVAAFALLGLVCAGAFEALRPVAATIVGLREEVETQRVLLGRLIAAEKGSAVRSATADGPSGLDNALWFLKPGSDAAMAAELQVVLGRIARASRIRLDTSQAAGVRSGEVLQLIALTVRFKTTLGALEAFLHAVETARPLLRVVALQVTPERGRSERGDDGLLVAMTVQAAARSATQVAKGAGDEG